MQHNRRRVKQKNNKNWPWGADSRHHKFVLLKVERFEGVSENVKKKINWQIICHFSGSVFRSTSFFLLFASSIKEKKGCRQYTISLCYFTRLPILFCCYFFVLFENLSSFRILVGDSIRFLPYGFIKVACLHAFFALRFWRFWQKRIAGNKSIAKLDVLWDYFGGEHPINKSPHDKRPMASFTIITMHRFPFEKKIMIQYCESNNTSARPMSFWLLLMC